MASALPHSNRGTAPDLDEVRRVIRPLLPEGCRAVLFGSRAAGTARHRSDWDIGLIGPGPVPGHVLERVREGLDNLPTLHLFEVVDLGTVPLPFRDAALREAVAL
jgi:predicted nucleotidyltransferase